MEKKIGKKVWFAYGRKSGFGIGFDISRWYTTIDLGFWYIGVEY
jgi:hypothetical protein